MTNKNLILTLIVFLLPLFSAGAQSIRGKVTDAKGEPLTGAVRASKASLMKKACLKWSCHRGKTHSS